MTDASALYSKLVDKEGDLQLSNSLVQSLNKHIAELNSKINKYQIAIVAILGLSLLAIFYLWMKLKNCSTPSASAEQQPAPARAVAVTVVDTNTNLFLSPDFNNLALVLSNGAYNWTLRYSTPSSVALLCSDQAHNVYFIDATNGKLTIVLSTALPENAYFSTDVTLLDEGQTSAMTKLISPSGELALSVNANDVAYSVAPQCASGMINGNVQMLATTQTTWTIGKV